MSEEIREHGPLGMAVFSPCRRYRYWLDRTISQSSLGTIREALQVYRDTTAVFVMLNPSVADCHQNDPTVRRCIGFATRWGCARLIVTNAFAFRSTDPRALREVEDPVGPDNIDAVRTATEIAMTEGPGGGPVVVAWGQHGGLNDHDDTVLGWIEAEGAQPMCLGRTRDGFPRHPLYVPNDTALVPYGGRRTR